MTGFRILILLAVISSTGFASYMTYTKRGAQSIEHPEGISLREESTRSNRRGGFFLFYYASGAGRSHRGGGLRGGK
ncbi:MAG: hypothetical protein PF637_14440 [Spirochaetes bacterium]|jgi:hypothetical protein|nr:hypothetical protein [Spirochaetota bacterium]